MNIIRDFRGEKGEKGGSGRNSEEKTDLGY
jgi:hypothetical protein